MSVAATHQCKYCAFKTNWEYLLNVHIEKNHPSIYELLKKDETINKSECICPKCYKSFANRYYLPEHLKRCRGPVDNCVCEYCERSFGSPNARNRHKQHCKVLAEIKKSYMNAKKEKTNETPCGENIASTSEPEQADARPVEKINDPTIPNEETTASTSEKANTPVKYGVTASQPMALAPYIVTPEDIDKMITNKLDCEVFKNLQTFIIEAVNKATNRIFIEQIGTKLDEMITEKIKHETEQVLLKDAFKMLRNEIITDLINTMSTIIKS